MDEQPVSDARVWERFFEVYEALPRGGPGDPASTRHALALMAALPASPRVLDLGCGPGTGSRALASLTGGRVTAFDLHAPFVVRQCAPEGPAASPGSLDGVCGDMRAAPFRGGAFDLVWSEGALYSIGFTEGLRVCAGLVRPGGYLAASEAVWTVPDPPDEVRRWWESEYPDIGSVDRKVGEVEAAGFDIVGHFTLPVSSWREHYYAPMRSRVTALREAWAEDPIGLGLLDQLDHEIAMCDRFGETYSYEFIVGRRPPGPRSGGGGGLA